VVIRHAEAEPPRPDDHARALTPRGRSDAAALRRWLLEHDLVPDSAVVSDAVRARETWQLADPGAGPARFERQVYEATAGDLREVIGQTADDVEVLALLGHNPAVERLVWELDPTDAGGMSPGAVAVFQVGDWALSSTTRQHSALPRG
jgi:phosphohistidine phosphatase